MPLSTNIDICNLAHLSSHKKNETMWNTIDELKSIQHTNLRKPQFL
jgi:hypothetical protein